MTDDTPFPPPIATPRRRSPARIATWSIVGVLLCIVVGLAMMAALAWHLLRTESGTRRLLDHLPYVAATGTRGALAGDFDAERVVVTLPNDGGTVTLTGLGWRGFMLSRTAAKDVWLKLSMSDLHAARVEVALKPKPGPSEPLKMPDSLHLPIEVDVPITLGELDMATLGATPLRDLRAHLHLGADGGTLHRIDGLHLAREPLVADGRLAIGASAPFMVDAQVAVADVPVVGVGAASADARSSAIPPAGTASSAIPRAAGGASAKPPADPASSAPTRELHAAATLTGPLAQPLLVATLRARADASQPEQTVAARATLAPFAAWPLAALQASTKSLDLSALVAGAPVTALTGEATATSTAADQPIVVRADLANERAGAWNEGRVPVRRLAVELQLKADDPQHLTLPSIAIDLGTQAAEAGRLTGRGAWSGATWNLDAALQAVAPSVLDARAPALRLSGPITLKGSGFDHPADGTVDLQADIAGKADRRIGAATPIAGGGPLGDVTLRTSATLNARRIDIRQFEARAGSARATLAGSASQTDATAPWVVKAQAALADFDPTPWWPGAPGSAWRRGPHRLNAKADIDLSARLATSTSASRPAEASTSRSATTSANHSTSTLWQQLAALRGRADLTLADSRLAGVPIAADIHLRAEDGRDIALTAKLDAAGNHVAADGRLSTAASGVDDRWTLSLDAPTLAALAPIWRLTGASAGDFGGSAQAKASLTGRWPAITTQGDLDASQLQAGPASVQRAEASWKIALTANGSTDLKATLTQAAYTDPHPPAGSSGRRLIESVQATIAGTAHAHTIAIDATSGALPPAWTDALMAKGVTVASSVPSSIAMPAPTLTPGPAPIPRQTQTPALTSTPTPMAVPVPMPAAAASTVDSTRMATSAMAAKPAASGAPVRSVASLRAEGGFIDATTADRSASSASPTTSSAPPLQFAGWRGRLQQVDVHPSNDPRTPWLRTGDIAIDARWAGAASVDVQAGRAEVLGGAIRWSRIGWQAAAAGQPARIDVDAELEPLKIAPLLARAQPAFGWGGDLAIGGHVRLHSAPGFTADVVIERRGGDLNVTDDIGTQPLGLTDLRLAVTARDGTWNFTEALAGRTLGTSAGAIVIRTAPEALMPSADAPISGTLELQVADLGTLGSWVPAGWRLAGALHASARVDGRFGAPEYTGQVTGTKLGVRNFLQGVDVTDGDLQVSLKGTTAHVDRFTAKAGTGTLGLDGDAAFGESPTASMTLTAERFQLLGRVDRKVVVSGRSEIRLRRDAVEVTGKFGIDEGLVDVSRSDAPALGDDVTVVRRSTSAPSAVAPAKPDDTPTTTARALKLDLQVGLGQKLHLRGHGIDTDLRGDLKITSPGGKLAVVGTIRTYGGTYAAYRQKLTIDRGSITFNGGLDNPQLDIQATRSDTDVKVGVIVTGGAVEPRVRLYSEPEVSDMDKLSWLVLGRASDGLGGTDTALLQQAALALLAGDGPSKTDEFTKAIGLDDIGLKQSDDGTSKSTVVALGKQLSRRWYVGYERGLSATVGSFQLVYRLAQRLTVRASSGSDNSLDVIWTLRWR